jgi:hypothetical protein
MPVTRSTGDLGIGRSAVAQAERPKNIKAKKRMVLLGGQFGYRIYGHSRFCNTDFRRYHWLA